MVRIFAVVFGLVTTLAALAPPAHGWGDVGHMTVAAAAYGQLTPATKDRVRVLLALNPKHDHWLTMLPAGTLGADRDMMIFMIASTWPDQIKRDSTYQNDGDRPAGSPDPGGNHGYDDKLMHKYWHFVDTPFSTDHTPLPPIPTPNAAERITLFRGVLASAAADPLKSYDLAWLLHVVGDVHQPLHCTTRVRAGNPEGDNGGNKVKVHCTGCPAQEDLHAFWDDVVGRARDGAAIAPAIAAAKKLPKPDPALAAKSDAKDWIAEGFEAGKTKVYQPPVGPGHGPFTLTAGYLNSAKSLADKRVALAAARLARLLNTELK